MQKVMIKRHQILFVIWILLATWGLLNLFSASYIGMIILEAAPYSVVFTHFVLFLALVVGYFISVRFGSYLYILVKKFTPTIFLGVMVLLVLVLVLGSNRDGASSVIDLGFMDIQPMEFYKIAMILFFAYMMSRRHQTNSISYLFTIFGICCIGLLLIIVEPDFGGTLICGLVLCTMVLINGEHLGKIFSKYFWMGSGILVLIFFFLFKIGAFHVYQLSRITTWLNPFADTKDAGYQMINSFIAISNGGVTGLGFMDSIQKSGFLDQSYTDFIYVVILEEWGIIGGLITIGLYGAFVALCFSIASSSEERFGELYCYGYGFLILTQAIINIGGTTGTIPMTGVTLPFISMGQNSYLTLGIGFLIVVIIDVHSNKKRLRRKLESQRLFESEYDSKKKLNKEKNGINNG